MMWLDFFVFVAAMVAGNIYFLFIFFIFFAKVQLTCIIVCFISMMRIDQCHWNNVTLVYAQAIQLHCVLPPTKCVMTKCWIRSNKYVHCVT